MLLAAGSLPAAARAFTSSDVLGTYVERLGGTAVPYVDAFFEYPPVVGYLSGVLLATIAVLLWTRLYSPQYSLWLVPFFALGVLPMRAFALLSLADLVIFATVFPLTLVSWAANDPAPTTLFAVLGAGVALRHVALIMAWVGAPARAAAS